MSVKTVQAIINGQTYTLTLNNDTGKYEATVTAPAKSSYNQAGHYYPVTVKSTDDAGNTTTKDDKDSTLGQSLHPVHLLPMPLRRSLLKLRMRIPESMNLQ